VLPVYDGAGLTGLVPALLGTRSAEWLPPPVHDAQTVVVLVLDGLGWESLQVHRETLPVLSSLEGGPITTVVPSTTATALTSLTTGLAPSRHGVVGYRIRVDECVLNVLSWHGEGHRPPDAQTFQRHPPFLGRHVPVVTKSEFRGSGFSAVHYGEAEFHGWSAMSSLVEHCRVLARDGAPFVYAYYPGVDSVAHRQGLHDGFYDAELRAADRLVGDVLDVLPPSTVLVVTADHGQIHLDADDWISLGSLAPLIDVCSGDGRFRYLHARRGAAAELADAARREHGGRAWVRSRAELLDEGWLGPDPSPAARARLGDVVLASRDDVGFIDPALPHESRLRSAHGSLTAAEMLVPALAGRGRGPRA
jgi:Type I phosphodiesterase / nucleotide pyrophosphatase